MPDSKANADTQERARISAEQQYEVAYFASRHALSLDEARRIIHSAGASRDKADALAELQSRTH